MRDANLIAVLVVPVALVSMAPASAQLPGLPAFPCHVLHVTNLTRNPALVNVSVDAAGLVRVGAGMVAACTTGDIPLAPNLRCGVTLNVHGEIKDPTRIPSAMFKLNPAAAPTIANVKGTFTPQNAAEPANWLALIGFPAKQLAWKPIAAGTRMLPGCGGPAPPPPPAPTVVLFTFTNTTPSPVLFSAGAHTLFINKACIAAGQSRSLQVPASTGYKMIAVPVSDAQCRQPIAASLVLDAWPVNGRVTIKYVASPYALKQLETPPPGQPKLPPPDPTTSTDPTVTAPDPTAPGDQTTPPQGDPKDPTTSIPTGK
jgi:hypothetical protein